MPKKGENMKEKILENLKTIIVITIILIIIGIILLIGMNQKQIDLEPLEFEQELEEPKEPETSKIKIDIKGEIKHPGVYQLEEGNRVSDQTTPNMIQRISRIFERNPLISKEI
jgi:competence protein ComEA